MAGALTARFAKCEGYDHHGMTASEGQLQLFQKTNDLHACMTAHVYKSSLCSPHI